MNIETFLERYHLEQNPFAAEEARLDPVFDRLIGTTLTHPDFAKIAGSPGKPSTSVVFGEKGTGKTAIRILLARQIQSHNHAEPDNKTLLIPYDELNPVLDNLMRAKKQDAGKLFESIRLADHQDAILSSAMTALGDAMLGARGKHEEPVSLPENLPTVVKRMSKQSRSDLSVLAALYDTPRLGVVFVLSYLLLNHASGLVWDATPPGWLTAVVVGSGLLSALLFAYWALRHVTLYRLAKRIRKETPIINQSVGSLKSMLARIKPGELKRQPWPVASGDEDLDTDSRYQLTRHLLDAIEPLGYDGMTVLIDRVDEPTLVAGDAEKMKRIIWPMFDAKFLQQDRLGVKMLLPIELRYELRKESGDFFREARLDKGNLIEKLTWTGSTLYDVCTFRLRACLAPEAESMTLMDLFDDSVDRGLMIESLDQMHQPRDAFKFLYAVIQQHCQGVPEDADDYKVARSTLDSVRRAQAERVKDLHRGLTPA